MEAQWKLWLNTWFSNSILKSILSLMSLLPIQMSSKYILSNTTHAHLPQAPNMLHRHTHGHKCTINSVSRSLFCSDSEFGNIDYFPNPSISPFPLIQVYSTIFSFWFLYHPIKSHFFFSLLTYFWRISED